MPRISRDIGEDAGLFEFSKPLIVSFVDTPMQIDTTGGDTYFNLQTGLGESEICSTNDNQTSKAIYYC